MTSDIPKTNYAMIGLSIYMMGITQYIYVAPLVKIQKIVDNI